jgi:hypothetical protein
VGKGAGGGWSAQVVVRWLRAEPEVRREAADLLKQVRRRAMAYFLSAMPF